MRQALELVEEQRAPELMMVMHGDAALVEAILTTSMPDSPLKVPCILVMPNMGFP